MKILQFFIIKLIISFLFLSFAQTRVTCKRLAFVSGKEKDLIPSSNCVVITGCDSGFGKDAAKKLAATGFKVVAGCLTQEGVRQLSGVVDLPIKCDVTNEKDIRRLKTAVERRLINTQSKLRAVINNAGIAPIAFVEVAPVVTFREVMEVNYFGAVTVSKAFIPLLKQAKNSRIINISSIAGLLAPPLFAPYSASKHALEAFGKSLRAELAPFSIQVAHINPGFMKTPLIPASIENALHMYQNAPLEIQQQYSIDSQKKAFLTVERIQEDPGQVSDLIVEMVQAQKLSFWNFPGFQAQIARYFIMLPKVLQELII